jgi:hypothetical protein
MSPLNSVSKQSEDLTNRWSRPRAAVLPRFILTSFLQFAARRALARGGSAPSR